MRNALLTCVLLVGLISPARADVIHLRGDFTIEAETLEDRGQTYRVHTRQGTYDIEKSQVVRIDPGRGALDAYDQEKTRHADTAAGHYALAQWCALQGLASERLVQLKRVIELDPEHADARRQLGYVRKQGHWIKTKPPRAPTDEERESHRLAKAQQIEIRKRVSAWFVKVKAIQGGRLDASRNDSKRNLFADGRRQILAIRDPFAMTALADILGRGDVPTRLLLIECLNGFEQDEAVMNLIVMALIDAAPDVRTAAANALVKRQDFRIISALRQGLASQKEWTIRNAASALGRLKAADAVPDLIDMLSTDTIQPIRVTVPVYLDSILYTFGRPTGYSVDASFFIYRPDYIGVLGPGALMGTLDRYELAIVSNYRTEVQEALIAITGQNLGFDRAAWWAWWRRQGG